MTRRTPPLVPVVLSLLCAAILAGSVAAQDADPRTRKLKRQIGILETVFNEVLVESPNFLVSGRDATHGLYLDEFGVLFTVEASLLNKSRGQWPVIAKGWSVIRGDDGEIIVTMNDDDDDDGDEDSEESEVSEASEEEHDHDDDDDGWNFHWNRESSDKWQAERSQAQRELYEAGKEELITTLLDYGETLTSLRDDQHVALAAFLKDSDFFFDRKISRLVLKIRVRDLRASATGRLSASALRERLIEEEY